MELTELNRRGRFRISHDVLRRDYRAAMAALEDVLVVRAESLFGSDCIEYVGYCPSFEPVERGAEAPFYEAQLTNRAGVMEVTWTPA